MKSPSLQVLNLIGMAFVTLPQGSWGYAQTLADCKAVASQFRNTCTQTPDLAADWTSFAGKTVTCTGMEVCPSGGGTAPNCSWSRKLCVSCSTDSISSKVYMRVQTNGFPDHCISGPNAIKEVKMDMKFVFNPVTKTKRTFTSQADFDNVACKPEKTYIIPSESDFTNMAGTTSMEIATIAGIAINGVPIYSSVSAENVDPYFPLNWSGAKSYQAERTDTCIGHPGYNLDYHYHMLPPCIFANITAAPCAVNAACNSNLKSFVLNAYSTKKQ